MAKVRMIVGVSGYRHDGEKWPPAGAILECPQWEADDLVNGGNAVHAGEEDVAHSGETVPATIPPGSRGEGYVTGGHASPAEVMTGHPDDPGAEVRAAKDQHGLRGTDPEGAQARRVSGLRENAGDPRPDSQILAEDFDPDERERIELGKTTVAKAKAAPLKGRRKADEEARLDHAGRRAAERQSALRYAAEGGITGAPGSEVPAGEAYPYAEGVRPASQAEAEDAIGARNMAGEDVSEPGLEGMSELERAEYESRMPGYTSPAEVRDEPAPGQPTLEEVPGGVPGAGPDTAAMPTGTGSRARGTDRGEARTGDEALARENRDEPGTRDDAEDKTRPGRHRVTAESEAPIDIRQDGEKGDEKAGDGNDGNDGQPDENSAPAPSATKQEWIDYAVRQRGADVHEASAMTKADLMSRYGGRL